jgi:membrane dipeptidase
MSDIRNDDRAARLHAASPVIVGHDHLANEPHLVDMQPAGLAAKVLHVSVDAELWAAPERREQSLHEYTGFTGPALAQIERVRRVVDANPDRLCLATTADDIVQAHRAHRSAIVLGFEGGKPIEQDLELLRVFYRLGLRVLQLTWAGGNDICDRRDPPRCEGLTPFGRSVLEEAGRLGILVDPGHCSRKTFDQVMELSRKAVACLHSTPAGAKPGAGDLDDDQVRAIAATGGVVGLHFFSHLLHPTAKATVEDLVDHVEYVAGLAGIDAVALGGDYLELTEAFVQAHGLPPSGFLGIPDETDEYAKLGSVTRALCARGLSDEDVAKVLGGNLLRVFRSVFGA